MCAFILPEGFEFKENALSHIEQCFILGNGPTLNKFILEKLNDYFVIGVNRILYSGFNPSIICISDPIVFSDEYVSILNETKCNIIIAEHVLDIGIKNYNLNKKNILKSFVLNFQSLYNTHFLNLYSNNLSSTCCVGSVIGDIAIPVAIYLGIRKIYMLGLDDYWDMNNLKDMHFYSNSNFTNSDRIIKTRYRNARYAKIDTLAAMQGAKIANLSPGSAIVSFEKLDAHDIFQNIIDSRIVDIINNYIKFENKLYKIVPPNNNINGCCSLLNIENGMFLRHYKGDVIYSLPEINQNCFPNDSSFFPETSFVDKNKISFRSYNMKNLYITKVPYINKYKIKKFSSDFIPAESSFEIFNCG